MQLVVAAAGIKRPLKPVRTLVLDSMKQKELQDNAGANSAPKSDTTANNSDDYR